MSTSRGHQFVAKWADGKLQGNDDEFVDETTKMGLESYSEFTLPYKSHNIIANSNIKDAGLGIFAGINYAHGDVVELTTFLSVEVLGTSQLLDTYTFFNVQNPKESIFALGWGSVINHSHEPNLMVIQDYERKRTVFIAKKKIKKGEELTFDYGESYPKPWEEKKNP